MQTSAKTANLESEIRFWRERGMGQNAHIENYFVLWNGEGVMEGSFSAKAVAWTRLRTLIFTYRLEM